MKLDLTTEERIRLRHAQRWDAEEQATPVALGRLYIEFSGLGETAYWEDSLSHQRTLINVEDCENS